MRHSQLAGGGCEHCQPERRIVRGHAGGEDRAGFGPSGQREKIDAAHDLRGRPDRRDLPIRHHDNGRRQPRHLGDRVADIDDRHLHHVAQPLDVREDLGPAAFVERGERLVHHQETRASEQRAANRDALLFAAREIGRPSRQ